jgi:hypothetical protein
MAEKNTVAEERAEVDEVIASVGGDD